MPLQLQKNIIPGFPSSLGELIALIRLLAEAVPPILALIEDVSLIKGDILSVNETVNPQTLLLQASLTEILGRLEGFGFTMTDSDDPEDPDDPGDSDDPGGANDFDWDIGGLVPNGAFFCITPPANADISWLTIHPYQEGVGTYAPDVDFYTLTPERVLGLMAEKLNDTVDTNPSGFDEDSVMTAVVGLGVTTGVSNLQELVKTINNFFDIPELQNFQKAVDKAVAAMSEVSLGIPLWEKQNIQELVPAYGKAMNEIKAQLQTVAQSMMGASAAANILMKKLEKKQKRLIKLKDTLDDLDKAFNDAASEANFYWAYMPNTNIKTLQETLENPFENPKDQFPEGANFSFGFLGLGTLSELGYFKQILGL